MYAGEPSPVTQNVPVSVAGHTSHMEQNWENRDNVASEIASQILQCEMVHLSDRRSPFPPLSPLSTML